ncbi:unnamed protein product, partial [Meganyctiphanes norvegica]
DFLKGQKTIYISRCYGCGSTPWMGGPRGMHKHRCYHGDGGAVSDTLSSTRSCQQLMMQGWGDADDAGSSGVIMMGGGSTADVRAALGGAGLSVVEEHLFVKVNMFVDEVNVVYAYKMLCISYVMQNSPQSAPH